MNDIDAKLEQFEERAVEVVPKEKAVQVVGQANPAYLLEVALIQGAGIEIIEKLMDLRERFEANEARKAFFEDLANFKAEAPPVSKDKYNKFFDSWYTSLGNLLGTYNPVLGRHGLSLSFPTPKQTDQTMTVECRLSHRLGHTESISMTGPIDQAAIGKASGQRSRTAIQDLKATFTYLRSATCEAVLGVSGTEASEIDNDGNRATEYITDKQLSELTDMSNKAGANTDQFLKFMKVESLDLIPANQFTKAKGALATKLRVKRQKEEKVDHRSIES